MYLLDTNIFLEILLSQKKAKICKDFINNNLKNMRRTAFYVFVVVAFGSELAKFIVLQFKFYKLKSFDSPIAGIVYSIFVSLGFSLSAVILYALGILGTEKMKFMTMFLWN